MNPRTMTNLLESDYNDMVNAGFALADAVEDAVEEDDRVVGEKYEALLAALAQWEKACPNRDEFVARTTSPRTGC